LGIQAGIDEFSASARVNQWERERHMPDVLMVERLANVLGAPAPYFYARDEALAAWILAFPKIASAAKAKLLKAAGSKP
jgi:transcriptional regulator with XRE-family HTH domain